MKILLPGFYAYLDEFDPKKAKRIERAGRLCYKSEMKGDPDKFIEDKCKRGHESILEHEKITVYVVCDRGVSHEIVRHRIAAYSQESTRYCNYSKDKFGGELTVIKPATDVSSNNDKFSLWCKSIQESEWAYNKLINGLNCTAQEARSVLPHSLKTEIAITYNMREWRHFFKLRTDKAAHPDIRALAYRMLDVFRSAFPSIFGDIEFDEEYFHSISNKVWYFLGEDDEEIDKFLNDFINGSYDSIMNLDPHRGFQCDVIPDQKYNGLNFRFDIPNLKFKQENGDFIDPYDPDNRK